MFLELDRKGQVLLTDLVESRVSELGSEIRRCRNSKFQRTLQDMRQNLKQILHRLHEAEWDVTC